MSYICLFPQLVAGPIVRFRQIEGDLDHIDNPPTDRMMARGIGFFVVGLVKKVIIADSFARAIDPLLANYQTLSVSGAWLCALGYTFQLYYDFSGYSDMAIGLGSLFGLRIPQNFDAPYRSAGIRDFWRRWHISLSTWLRDYLYIRLGGNRKGDRRTQMNLLITMLLGGLWHGANWTFVFWGFYHGMLLLIDRWLDPWIAKIPQGINRARTFFLVVIGWVLFRSNNLPMAIHWLGKMFGWDAASQSGGPWLLLSCGLALLAVNLLPETWEIEFGQSYRWAFAYALAFFLSYLMLNTYQSTFLYYQF